MFRSVKIEGYRRFASYEMRDLGRVNLLVGSNNSGKTSVLEALYVLGTDGDPIGLWDNCIRRGEIFRDKRALETRLEADTSHLFHGHDLMLNSLIAITPDADESGQVSVRVDERAARPRDEDFGLEAADGLPRPSRLSLMIRGRGIGRAVNLSVRGGLELDLAEMFSQPGRPGKAQSVAPALFVTTQGVSPADLVKLWDEVQLAGDESLVVELLKSIDPEIDDIRSLASAATAGPREGFVVRRAKRRAAIVKGSGFDALDEAARDWIARASPVPAFLADMPGTDIEVVVPFRFTLR